MKQSLTPRQLAHAIGVSESSMKRWVDEGRVRASRTAGGHRRIPIAEALRFVRESSLELIAPDALGMPELATISVPGDDRLVSAGDQMVQALDASDRRRVQSLILGLFLGGESIASIVDGPIRLAMEEIGERWRHSEEGLVIEHEATDTINQCLNQIRGLFPTPEGAMCAVGGTLEGDPYLLASLAAATALATEGIEAVHLGPQTPADSLAYAARRHDAKLVWVSVSVPLGSARIEDQLTGLASALREEGRRLMIGGRGVAIDRLPRSLRDIPRGASISELVGFAKGLSAAQAA